MHHPHPKVLAVSLLLFWVLGSSLHRPSQGPLAPRQDCLLPSPCREALLMVDHLKMLLVHGWSLPYASLSLFSPQAGPSTTVQGSRKQSTSTFTGGSGTQAGSSTPFTLQGSTAYGGSSPPQDGGSFQSQSLSTKYTPESQHSPYCTSVAGQGTLSASASEVLSSYSSMNNQNAPAQPSRRSSSSRFYSVKG